MKLKIVEVNFSSDKDWIFRMHDEYKSCYFIMDANYYRNKEIKSPITKKELDSLNVGECVSCSFEKIDQKNIVFELY